MKISEHALDNVDGITSKLDFLKYVNDSVFKTEEVKEAVPSILILSGLDLVLKAELFKKVPIAMYKIKSIISDPKLIEIRDLTRWHTFSSTHDIQVSIDFDFKFLNHVGLNLAEEKIFSKDKNQTFFNYVLSRIHAHRTGEGNSSSVVEQALGGVLSRVAQANSKWVTDWANSPSSFKGHNPIVLASMFNEVGIVKALLGIDGVDVSVVDEKTGYNAFEWQYVVNSFMWNFTYSKIASALSEKGASVRSDVANLLGKPNGTAKTDMEKKLKETSYPFGNKSNTTKVVE